MASMVQAPGGFFADGGGVGDGGMPPRRSVTATPTLEWMRLDPDEFDAATRARYERAVAAGRGNEVRAHPFLALSKRAASCACAQSCASPPRRHCSDEGRRVVPRAARRCSSSQTCRATGKHAIPIRRPGASARSRRGEYPIDVPRLANARWRPGRSSVPNRPAGGSAHSLHRHPSLSTRRTTHRPR